MVFLSFQFPFEDEFMELKPLSMPLWLNYLPPRTNCLTALCVLFCEGDCTCCGAVSFHLSSAKQSLRQQCQHRMHALARTLYFQLKYFTQALCTLEFTRVLVHTVIESITKPSSEKC